MTILHLHTGQSLAEWKDSDMSDVFSMNITFRAKIILLSHLYDVARFSQRYDNCTVENNN